jgi:DNA ligase-associated metallophosphoesterase
VQTFLSGVHHYTLFSQDLLLLPQKAIFWQNTNTLLLADVHLGKVNHFRKSGIAIPNQLSDTDYQTLDLLLKAYPVSRVLILGDLFHSLANQACITFSKWLKAYPDIEFILVKGNHDILPEAFYDENKVKVHSTLLIQPPFVFSHIPLTEKSTYYNIAGHIHPAVKLIGRAKQLLVLPCFYFGKENGILPAFSAFSGKAILSVMEEDAVFVIGNQVVTPMVGPL